MEEINRELLATYIEFMEECVELQYADEMLLGDMLNVHYMNELSANSYDFDAVTFGEMA